eukprot:3424188-Pleurochrysis_carterae.AAC.1
MEASSERVEPAGAHADSQNHTQLESQPGTSSIAQETELSANPVPQDRPARTVIPVGSPGSSPETQWDRHPLGKFARGFILDVSHIN